MVSDRLARYGTLAFALVAVAPGLAVAQEPTLSRVFQIGASDAVPEYSFGVVADLTFGPGGEIYVLDAVNSIARAYDQTGRYLRSIGGKGEGPGEVRFPSRVIASSTRITLFDASLMRAVAFDSSGLHLETTRLDSLGSPFGVVVPLRDGKWLGVTNRILFGHDLMRFVGQSASMIRREGPAARDRSGLQVALIDPGTSTVDTIFTYDHGFILSVSSRGVGMLPRFWGHGGGWAVSGDSLIALVDGMRGGIRILRVTGGGSEEVRTGRVRFTQQPLGEEEWRQVEAMVREERNLPPDLHLIGPAYKPEIGEPVFADDGTLWVQRLAIDPSGRPPPSATVYLLIPPDDRPQSVVRLPAGFALKAVRGDLLLGLRRTDLGVDLVELWRLHRQTHSRAGAQRPGS